MISDYGYGDTYVLDLSLTHRSQQCNATVLTTIVVSRVLFPQALISSCKSSYSSLSIKK